MDPEKTTSINSSEASTPSVESQFSNPLLTGPSKDNSATSNASAEIGTLSDVTMDTTSAVATTSVDVPLDEHSRAQMSTLSSIPPVLPLPALSQQTLMPVSGIEDMSATRLTTNTENTASTTLATDTGASSEKRTGVPGSNASSIIHQQDESGTSNPAPEQKEKTDIVESSSLANTEADQEQPRPSLVSTPWQDILINMLSEASWKELGFTESSRMMTAEGLVLSTTQRNNAPAKILKFARRLQESVPAPVYMTIDNASGSSKRHNVGTTESSSRSPDGYDAAKRRRVDDSLSMIQENATRKEIEDKMETFIAMKREQINESNRQEFIKGRAFAVDDTTTDPSSSIVSEDDGCARVDARKLNRTIQMKLETVKNDALTRTNPKSHPQASDVQVASSGLDERLRNIQVHLNLRFAATPACTIAERIRIIEDVIIQLERDYPLWSALHFNQPNRLFPPPPSVTTVSRNAKNQIVMTGEHLHTTLIENGDATVHQGGIMAQHCVEDMSRSSSGGQTGHLKRTGITDVDSRATHTTGATVAGDNRGAATAGVVRSGTPTSGVAGGSATVIKLKRHGGAGSSSLARAVQQQLAQRKAMAASGGYTIDESKSSTTTYNNGSTSTFKISPAPLRGSISDSGSQLSKPGPGSQHMSNPSSSLGGSLSPALGFTDLLKPGVTGRGPIKSRRKSIAKGLDPSSTMTSLSATHPGNILSTNPGTPLNVTHTGGTMTSSLANQLADSTGTSTLIKPKPANIKKPRKKKDDGNVDESTVVKRAGAGRGKGGFGLGKGKGGARSAMGLGLGKGKGGAYRQELLRRAEVEEFDDESDDDGPESNDFQPSTMGANQSGPHTGVARNGGNETIPFGHATTFINDNSALAQLVNSALKDQADTAALAQQVQQIQQKQKQQQQGQEQPSQPQQQRQQVPPPPAPSIPKTKAQARKAAAPLKPPPVRKFGGKSFGMAGGESSGSSSNESSDGEGTGSSGSQSDSSSSSGSIGGSDPGDSD
ncbi:hypothetical protein BG011_004623 [Mortierella polycephala]|uniref:Uncharacterized protein n=1 Tax=Mortierella polycephala TaxID=41804 RepID=A0A9P6U240_9FUNG|nr:hypothetical protein BG011_004623 [Mortierella polycephala]